MKVKNLAENGLTGSDIGDAMSAQAQEGWLEYDLQMSIRAYMRANNFEHGYAFAKMIETMALKAWREEVQAQAKRLNADKELPF
tara:strand:- start:30 stop:281 length:252 start_codon:yes stop_codon:yes gene_type:complete